MHAAEVVIRKMNSQSQFKVVQFLREGVREARKPSHGHAHGEVLSFHEAVEMSLLLGFPIRTLGITSMIELGEYR